MRIEQEANKLLHNIVKDRLDLTIKTLAEHLGIIVIYNRKSSFTFKASSTCAIAIKFDTPANMFETFCHELGHMMLHHTNQNHMPRMFNQKQEAEANKFAMCVMMPEKLIYRHELYNARDIMSYFGVDEATALERIDMLIMSSKRNPIIYYKEM